MNENIAQEVDIQPAVEIQPVREPIIEGVKFNLGCGHDIKPGWTNVDLHGRHNPTLVCDVTNLKPVDDKVASYVLAQDILEHIHRERCLSTLQEWNRIMKIDGILELRVPDVFGIVNLMRSDQFNNAEGHKTLLQCLFGTQGYNGDFHFNGFTEVFLRDQLEQAGFEVTYVGIKDDWLLDVLAKKIKHCPPSPLLKIESAEEFVEHAYLYILGREPDPQGKDYCMDQLSEGISKENIIAMLTQSDEAKARNQTQAPT